MTGKGGVGAVGFAALLMFTTFSFVSSKLVQAGGTCPGQAPPGVYIVTDDGVNNTITPGQPIGFDWQGGDSPTCSSTATLVATLPSNPGLSWTINWSTQPCAIAGGVLTCTFTMSPSYTHIGVDVVSSTTTASAGTVSVTGTLTEGGTTVATAAPVSQVIA